VEGDDAKYYNLIYKQFKGENNSSYFYQLSIMPAPNKNIRDKINLERLIIFLRVPDDNIEMSFKKYDSVYALIDDDGDLYYKNRINLNKLFYLDRYSKENYVLDPINLYIYLKHKKPNSEIVMNIENEAFKNFLDLKALVSLNTEDRLKLYLSVLSHFKSLILDEYFNNKKSIDETYYEFNDWKIELNYPKVFTLKNKKNKFLLFRNLFSIHNFDIFGLNKHNDPIKFYFTCKCYLRLLVKQIAKELEENFNETNIVICDLINHFYERCDEIKDRWNLDLIKCTECMSIEKLLIETMKINYFTDRCFQNISTKKKDFIEDMLVTYKDIDLDKFFKISYIVKKIEIKNKIQDFIEDFNRKVKGLNEIDLVENKYVLPTEFHEEEVKSILQEYLLCLSEKLKNYLSCETEPVYINLNEKIDYPKFLLHIRGHDLEEIIYKHLDELKEIPNLQNTVIDFFEKKDEAFPSKMFLPYDLELKLKSLTNVYIHLTESNFEDRVFNSNMNWFVKLIHLNDFAKDDPILTKA
jgi:hypothetical protein